jgi:hypothetical protein
MLGVPVTQLWSPKAGDLSFSQLAYIQPNKQNVGVAHGCSSQPAGGALSSDQRSVMAGESSDSTRHHVVVVGFENRSLDSVPGREHGPGDGKTFEGVTGP